MTQKIFHAPIKFKADGQEGEFTAEFATLNVIDHDRDVILPGAFHEGQETLIEPWNHNYGELPVGKGVIHEKDNKAIVDGKFFLDTQASLEHYRVVKALGSLQEWSFTFDIEKNSQGQFEDQEVQFLEKLDVWGVAPVTRGAGKDTRTTDIKSQKKAVASHTTATTDASWDGPANESNARSGENAAYYRKIYAWQDPDGDPAVKASWRFIHHMVPSGGEPGAANIRACQSAIGVLNGGRGGTTIPDADRKGVWNHLAKHLRDADLEPPELKSLENLQLEDQTHTGKSSEVIRTQIELVELED
jgi:HK97 family phage prohead protease